MKRIKTGILLGLACTSILGLSVGVQSVKADEQTPLQHSQMLNDDFNVIGNDTPYFQTFKANNLLNGNITTGTTKMTLQVIFYNRKFVIRDSNDVIIKEFTSTADASPFDVDVSGLFKAGETYSVTPPENTNKYFSFNVVSNNGMNDFNVIGNDTPYFQTIKANNLAFGNITTGTTKMTLQVIFYHDKFVIRDSNDVIVKEFTSTNDASPFDVDVSGLFKAGETYSITPPENTNKYFSFIVI